VTRGFWRAFMKVGTRGHIALYRASGGRIAGKAWGLPILLLTTTGRKTGKQRTTPLCYLPDGDRFVVIASNGGMDWYPAWWLNLAHAPEGTAETGRDRVAVRMHEAVGEERERLWAEITTIAPGYLKYEARTKRRIPLAILERA
jgi:deazaflavin-dependent oxidoreductase (nitroreductase family)